MAAWHAERLGWRRAARAPRWLLERTVLGLALAAAAAHGDAAPGTRTTPAAVAAPSPAPSPAPTVGPAPGNPRSLFSMAPAPPCEVSLCWTAHQLTASRTHIVMVDPDIVDTTRGLSHITADRAEETGADIGNSQIVLTGEVHADMSQGQLAANTATVQVVNKRISSIVAQGSPAQFLRLGKAPVTGAAAGKPTASKGSPAGALADVSFHGHADSITYDLQTGIVQLNGNGWLTDGCNEFTSEHIVYDAMTQTVQAGPAPGAHGRVYGTIRNTRPGGSCTATGAAGKS